MQPAVRLLLGSLPQPVFFTGVISRIAIGGGVRGRQFGESATTRPDGSDHMWDMETDSCPHLRYVLELSDGRASFSRSSA
jgi:hypothetical protein